MFACVSADPPRADPPAGDLAALNVGLIASDSAAARSAEKALRKRYTWADADQAERLVVLGGDGFMLQTLHAMLEEGRSRPLFGMNRGTVGFLMNDWRANGLAERLAAAKSITIAPLQMTATTCGGETVRRHAINEVSLLRQMRQTARIELSVDGRVVMPELVCDGVLVATPAGSTAYNFSARGPILPLSANMLALTPIAPFRPRRWSGAILPDEVTVGLKVIEPRFRPVAAVADQYDVRDLERVVVALDRSRALTLLFDPGHALDERVAMEQFLT
jgi:NAD+ kinase